MASTSRDIDVFKELVNIGIGDAAASLATLLGARVEIRVPDIQLVAADQVPDLMSEQLSAVGVFISQDFAGTVRGRALLAYTRACSRALLSALTGERQMGSLSRAGRATLQEVGNIILGSCLTTVSNLFAGRLDFALPEVSEGSSHAFFSGVVAEMAQLNRALVVRNEFTVRDIRVEGYLVLLLGFDDFHVVIERARRQFAGSGG